MAHSYPNLSFADRLEAEWKAPDKRKGERTRDRLKAAAARVLENVGYRDLRVTDINEAASVSNALFYVYFKNKEEVTEKVLTEFLASMDSIWRESRRPQSAAESIYYGNLGYIRMFEANPGLMRCLLQFGDETPEFASLWRDWNGRWTDRMVRALERDDTVKLRGKAEMLAAASALGSMVDGLLRLIYLDREERLRSSVTELSGDAEGFALFLTRLWYRGLYARELEWKPAARETRAKPAPKLRARKAVSARG